MRPPAAASMMGAPLNTFATCTVGPAPTAPVGAETSSADRYRRCGTPRSCRYPALTSIFGLSIHAEMSGTLRAAFHSLTLRRALSDLCVRSERHRRHTVWEYIS